MGQIRDLAEAHWHGEGDLVHEHHPVHVMFPDAEELAEGLLYYKGIASACAVDTGDGLVLLDTGHQIDTLRLHEQVRAWRPDTPLAAAIFSHHHVDHVFGTGPFEEEATTNGWAQPLVYGHENLGANFDRYLRTRGWNRAINVRQFAIYLEAFEWPDRFRYPDVTFRDRLTFRRGGLTFELRHDKGETDDATWTWIPERRILHTGDLFIWAVPNAGNPQKVQRFVGEWAAALRRMAGLGAEVLLAGHGLPIFGAERVTAALSDTAELLESIEGQTLDLMNRGVTLDEVIHTVRVPDHLTDRPYLQPVYDHPQFLVRNIWRRFGGWWDGEPDTLLPAPRSEQAREWVALAGGVDRVLERVAELRAAGEPALACHLVEFAVLADPGSTAVHEARRAVYAERAGEQVSSMARNILNHAALASEQGRRDLAGSDRA
jgi:alkyl sulfatase BDS1-like metallo-beta-lactamase superfamily hydrolase